MAMQGARGITGEPESRNDGAAAAAAAAAAAKQAAQAKAAEEERQRQAEAARKAQEAEQARQMALAAERERAAAEAERQQAAQVERMRAQAVAIATPYEQMAQRYAAERATLASQDPAQNAVVQRLAGAMEGREPSAAQIMAQQQADAIRKQTAAAGARTGNPALMRAALMSGAEQQQIASGQASALRAQEMDAARAQWAQAYQQQQALQAGRMDAAAQLELAARGGVAGAQQLGLGIEGTERGIMAQQAQSNVGFERQLQVMAAQMEHEKYLAAERQKFEAEMSRLAYERAQEQAAAQAEASFLPALFSGALGGAATGFMVGGPMGALAGAGIGAGGALLTRQSSPQALPGYGQMATTAGSMALMYGANRPKLGSTGPTATAGTPSYPSPYPVA